MTTPNITLTPFQTTFSDLGIAALPTVTSFVLHPDIRVPSILALFLLLLASGRYSGRMSITKENWRRVRRVKWLRMRGEEEDEEDEEERLRAEQGKGGVGGLRGVERWRGKMFGGEKEMEGESTGAGMGGGQRDQGRLVASFVILLFFFCFPTIWSLVSFRPTHDVLCGLVGVVSFLLLAATRYAALFKVSLDLQLARGRRVVGEKRWGGGGEAAKRWEVLGLRAFVVVAIIMSLFSSIFSRGFLRVLPAPFNSSALCFRRTFLLYAIPLSLNLAIALYSLGRIFVISHWRRNSWSVVFADGRIRRAGVFSIWVASSFAQELGVGEMTGSGMWLPTCLGAGVLMAVMESPPYLPQPPPAPSNTPQPTITSTFTHADSTDSPFTSFLHLNSPPPSHSLFSSKLPPSHKSTASNPQLVVALNNDKVHEAFRQDFNSFKLRKSEEEESDDGQDIVNQAATEPSTVFYAPSIPSPVTINSEASFLREGGGGKWEMIKSSNSEDDNDAYGGTMDEQRRNSGSAIAVVDQPRKARLLPSSFPFPSHPRRLEDSTILNDETKVLRVSQHLYSIPRPFTPSTQDGGQTTTTDSHFPYHPTIKTATVSSVEQARIHRPLPTPQGVGRRGGGTVSSIDAFLPDQSSPSIQPDRSNTNTTAASSLAHNNSVRTARTFGDQQRTRQQHQHQKSSSSSSRSFVSHSSSSSSDLPNPGPPPAMPLPRTPSPPSKGLPASPARGPATPPKDGQGRSRDGHEQERERRGAPRVKTFDFSVPGRGGGQGSLGDLRF